MQTLKGYKWSRGIAPLIRHLGTSWRWVVTFMPWQLNLRWKIHR